MPIRLPVRRYLQATERTEAPKRGVGSVQWVLSRALYRFQVFDFSQVPSKSRNQALQLELTQWTPFAASAYYICWQGSRAWVWGWNADRVRTAMAAQQVKPARALVLPETLLHPVQPDGLCLICCAEGFEGQLWRNHVLQHCRWWPQSPCADDWLSFQRDAGVSPDAQQTAVPTPQVSLLADRPWLRQSQSAISAAAQLERPLMALAGLCLAAPALWFGLSLYQTQQHTAALMVEKEQLQRKAAPIMQARTQSLEKLGRIEALRTLAPMPDQLGLMAMVAEILPKNGTLLKAWSFSDKQLTITLSANTEIAASPIIAVLQQSGQFSDIKSLPGRDSKSAVFQMNVKPNHPGTVN